MDPVRLQDALHNWRLANFPRADSNQQLLGMVEELGELAKARLKMEQQIRSGTDIPTAALDEQDAIADLTIYMMGYCSYKGWDYMSLVSSVAEDVMKRDWVKYPKTGHPE